MKSVHIIGCLVLALINFKNSLAQETFPPPPERPSIVATKIDQVVSIDGILNEQAWNQTPGISDFVQIEPYQGLPSQNKTTVRILYNDKFLFIGVSCFDSLGRTGIRAPDMLRDFNWRAHDVFAVCIDGFNDKRNSVSFVTNAYGVQKDYLSFDNVLFDGDWNGLWKVRTTITDEGWFAEFQIPWKSVRYAQTNHPEWGINFLRLRRVTNEISVWSSYPRSFGFNRMEYAGLLKNIQPPAQPTNIQINPYTLGVVSRRAVSNGPSVDAHKVKAGGELKWALSSNTLLDATINTDFAQADADVQVNNVSRFSILFPERRQFFLENASLFAPGLFANDDYASKMQILPFFSRRVGLSETGSPIPIKAGVRFVTRSVTQNLGIMAVRQDAQDSLPASNCFVGRYYRNIGARNRLGLISTVKQELNGNTNIVYGFDSFIRLGRFHSINVMALSSSNAIKPGSKPGSGLGGYVQYNYLTNKINAWITEALVNKTFDPALGFLSRTDVANTTAGLVANLRGKVLPLKKYIRSWQPAVFGGMYQSISLARLLESDINFVPIKFELQNGGYYSLMISHTYQFLNETFNPLEIPIAKGEYNYTRFTLTSGSDPSRKISYAFKYEFGNYFDGSLRSINLSISHAPIPHVSLTGSIDHSSFGELGVNLTSKEVMLLTLKARFSLNPRLQLVGLYQKNSLTSSDSYNIRFSWEYQPLSYIYLVFNSRSFRHEGPGNDMDQQGIFKLSYLKQF